MGLLEKKLMARGVKGGGEKALDELCKIAKNNLERFTGELKRAKGDRHTEFDSELVKSWGKENKLLKKVFLIYIKKLFQV